MTAGVFFCSPKKFLLFRTVHPLDMGKKNSRRSKGGGNGARDGGSSATGERSRVSLFYSSLNRNQFRQNGKLFRRLIDRADGTFECHHLFSFLYFGPPIPGIDIEGTGGSGRPILGLKHLLSALNASNATALANSSGAKTLIMARELLNLGCCVVSQGSWLQDVEPEIIDSLTATADLAVWMELGVDDEIRFLSRYLAANRAMLRDFEDLVKRKYTTKLIAKALRLEDSVKMNPYFRVACADCRRMHKVQAILDQGLSFEISKLAEGTDVGGDDGSDPCGAAKFDIKDAGPIKALRAAYAEELQVLLSGDCTGTYSDVDLEQSLLNPRDFIISELRGGVCKAPNDVAEAATQLYNKGELSEAQMLLTFESGSLRHFGDSIEEFRVMLDPYDIHIPQVCFSRKFAVDPEQLIKICFNCGVAQSEDVRLMKCSRCKKATYCSRACAKEHWKVHRPNCISAACGAAGDGEDRGVSQEGEAAADLGVVGGAAAAAEGGEEEEEQKQQGGGQPHGQSEHAVAFESADESESPSSPPAAPIPLLD